METIQGPDVEVPPRDLVELPRHSGTKPQSDERRQFYVSRVATTAKDGRMDKAQPFYNE